MIVIMTAGFASEKAVDVDQWKDHVAVAREKGFAFVHVNISCTMKVNKERVVSEERKTGGKKKNVSVENLEMLRKNSTMIDPLVYGEEVEDVLVKFCELDNTRLTVEEAVDMLRKTLDGAGDQLTES